MPRCNTYPYKGGWPITLADIAKELNVSTAAVSFVLNGKPGVSAQKRKIIADCLTESGYQVKEFNLPLGAQNSALPNIRFIKFRKDGLFVDHNGDYITRLMDGAEYAAKQNDLTLSVMNVDNVNLPEAAAEVNRDRQTVGLVFLGTEFDHRDAALLRSFQKPVVFVDNRLQNLSCNCVTIDHRDSVLLAIEHLYSLGHRRITMLCSSLHYDENRERELAFRMAVQELEIPQQGIRMLDVPPVFEQASECVNQYLRQADAAHDATAYFCGNDSIALGALRAFKQQNIRVPEDVSIIGFDDLQASSMAEPPLTTMAVDSRRMGRLAVERLIEILSTSDDSIQKLHLDAHLVVRKSTGPPPGHPA